MINPNSVNLQRSLLIFNTFHLFFSAAKASLFPFLTLFYRHLGLTAVQTGYLMAAKMLSTFVWVPFWTRYAARLKKRHLFLICSIMMMLITNLSVWLVSSSIDNILQKSCSLLDGEHHAITDSIISQITSKNPNINVNSTSTRYPKSIITVIPHIITPNLNSSLTTHKIPFKISKTTSKIATTFSRTASKKIEQLTKNVFDIIDKEKQNSSTNGESMTTQKLVLVTVTVSNPVETGSAKRASVTTVVRSMDTAKETVSTSTPDQQAQLITQSVRDESVEASDTIKERVKRHIEHPMESETSPLMSAAHEFGNNSWEIREWWNNFKSWAYRVVMVEQSRVFVILLVVILIGESFGSAAEKLADDSLYDLLDCLDRLEKYGKHRIWSSLSFLIVPTGIGILVDHTQCLLPFHMNHILIHCFAFTAFLMISLLLSLIFPSPTYEKLIPAIRLRKGIEVTCFNCNGFVYMTTVFIMGGAYSTISNFLFWFLEDLGGNETVMGMCILVATLSEMPILLYGEHLVRSLGSAGTTCLSMLFCTIRVLVYSFVFSPWYILPLELFHAFTHTAMWYAVFSNPIFNISPDIDRRIRNILSSAYFGIGFSAGSIISGYVVDSFGIPVLFRVVAAVCLLWCIVFFLIEKYIPKEQPVKYQRLLQTEDDENNSDDSATMEADWLEQALKDS